MTHSLNAAEVRTCPGYDIGRNLKWCAGFKKIPVSGTVPHKTCFPIFLRPITRKFGDISPSHDPCQPKAPSAKPKLLIAATLAFFVFAFNKNFPDQF